MARLDRTSGGFIPKKVTLTCLATSYSLVGTVQSSTQRFERRICFIHYAFSHFFLIKKIIIKIKIGLNDQIYFTTLGWEQCHNLNELKFTLLL